jgi:hypothetical protein
MELFEHFEALRECSYLFLEELVELTSNSFKIRVAEGFRSSLAIPIEVAGHSLGEGFLVEITSESSRNELTWPSCVLYQVTNELYGRKDPSDDGILGMSASVSRSSAFLEQVLLSTTVSDEYPGKPTHYRVGCEDHVVDVVSCEPPRCHRIGPNLKVN